MRSAAGIRHRRGPRAGSASPSRASTICCTGRSISSHLKTDEDIAYYLEAVFEDGDPALITHALRDIARVKGTWQIAEAAGLGRESVHKAFALEGKLDLATILKVLHALGLKLKVAV
jgi:probable addiction module antidote protein